MVHSNRVSRFSFVRKREGGGWGKNSTRHAAAASCPGGEKKKTGDQITISDPPPHESARPEDMPRNALAVASAEHPVLLEA